MVTMRTNINKIKLYLALGSMMSLLSCKKLIEIAPPVDTITTEQVFKNNKQAEWAMAGVYSRMINGNSQLQMLGYDYFSAGLANLAGSLSSDQLLVTAGSTDFTRHVLNTNALTILNAVLPNTIWSTAYKTVYDANGVIEGIAASTSPQFTDSARRLYTAEAKVIRAFSYFYLTNFFGDLPMVLTIDYNKTKNLTRSSVPVIYAQILKDLTEAKNDLPDDFSNGNNERVRVNKWLAEALLARVYLYTRDYQQAINSATTVIDQTGLFQLESDLDNVFKKNNPESIWQLAQHSQAGEKSTPEGKIFVPPSVLSYPAFYFPDQLLALFDPSDKRKSHWMASFDNGTNLLYYPFKYKIGLSYGTPEEYYTVMRLAELYLIRAEARVLLAAGNKNSAIGDLNVLRQRAGIADLSTTLTADQVVQAIADERQRELFVEWGHRWFDLKRTGKAADVLSAIPYKQPWKGDYQLLYPVPKAEVEANIALGQNPEYNKL
jgi:hypothetical protein